MADRIDTASERARAEKAEAERDEWIETARHHSNAGAAFLGWLRSAGEHMRAFGVTICDDGSDAGEVLVAKVPKCAKAMAGRITDLEAERDHALAQMAAVKRVTKCARCGSDGGFGCYECIPSDEADAALQRVMDAAWNAAVEAAAQACALMPTALPASPRMAFEAGLSACESHIRALKRPEASHD